MQSERFNILLQRYLARTASEQEAAEFLELARENELHLRRLMDERLKGDHIWLGSDKELEEELQLVLLKSRKRAAQTRITWMAAASLVIFLIAGAWVYSRFANLSDITAQEQTTITFSGKDYIPLPDGSHITLRDGGKISYDTKAYGIKSRDIILTGEAYFDVAHNPDKPFRVHTGKIVTTVLGTVFDVDATNPEHVTVSVSSGKVSVGNETRSFGIITPNEQMAVNSITEEVMKTTVDSQAVAQWKKDYFILDRVTIAEAADLIGKRFNVKVTVKNESLNKCVISAYFLNKETLDQVVKAVSAFRQANYTIVNDIVTIKDGRGCD